MRLTPRNYKNISIDANTLKLGQLEDIEDIIDCPLEVYFKMCVFGTTLYTTKYGNPEEPQKFKKYIYNHVYRAFCLRIRDILTPIYFTVEYGRAWAINKEDLNKQKKEGN